MNPLTILRSRSSAQLGAFAFSFLLLGSAAAAPASEVLILGQTASPEVIVDGSPVPSGTTLLSPSVLETDSQQASIYLAQGQILELDSNTRTYLAATPWGELEMLVEGGSVVVQGGDSEPVAAGVGERLVFIQPEVQVAQLGGSSSNAALGLPIVALAAGGCSVNASGECTAEGFGCSDRGGSCECVATDEATGICEKCDCKVTTAASPKSGRGLSTRAWIGIGVGAAAGAAVLINELDDDDEPAASPVN